ncbi:MAG: hypothetical protein [Caudoviricetes sp.]|nr:MAG: hypothetical protein [Caudoviricetes sp.]
MKLYPSQITVEQLISEYTVNGEGYSDGIQIFNANKRAVGFVTDLKVKLCSKGNTKAAINKRAKIRAEERKQVIGELSEEMECFIRSECPNVSVFINETMPNVDINGTRFYIIIGHSLENSIRLNVCHSEFNADDWNDMITGYKCRSHDSENERNVMFGSLSRDDVASILNQVAEKLTK